MEYIEYKHCIINELCNLPDNSVMYFWQQLTLIHFVSYFVKVIHMSDKPNKEPKKEEDRLGQSTLSSNKAGQTEKELPKPSPEDKEGLGSDSAEAQKRWETLWIMFAIFVSTFTIAVFGGLMLFQTNNLQSLALSALISCLIWLFAYFVCRYSERKVESIICGSISSIMGLIFGVLLLVWSNSLLLFLTTAPFLLFFPFSYMAYYAFQRPVRIKRLRTDFELLTAQWDEELYEQSTNFFNYALHITLVILITSLGLFVAYLQLASDTGTMGLSREVMRAIAFGFLGSLLFSYYNVYRRYTTSDLLPSVYLYCAITIILGMVFNYVSFRSLEGISSNNVSNQDPERLLQGVSDLLAFAIGLFPILAVQWLTRTVYKAFGQRQRRSDLFALDQIDGISQAQEVRLRDYGIDDAQNLASVEMPMLLINTPFPVQRVVDWVDQSILMVLLNDISALDNFRKAHIRTMTDFRDVWEPFVKKERDLKQERGNILRNDMRLDEKAVKDKVDAIEIQLTEGKEEQNQLSHALNSNSSLLNALYSSTNFDMNIHYLINYRKNVELLLPSWTSARYNGYLIEAYRVPDSGSNPYEVDTKLARIWHFVKEYVAVNTKIEEARELDQDDGSLGDLVSATSLEACLGLIRLLDYLVRSKTRAYNRADEKDKAALQNEIGVYTKRIDEQWCKACEQYKNLRPKFESVDSNRASPCAKCAELQALTTAIKEDGNQKNTPLDAMNGGTDSAKNKKPGDDPVSENQINPQKPDDEKPVE
jgi:hypothetical protein